MKTDNIIQIKTFSFAVRVIKVCRFLSEEKKEYCLSKQLIRSATSIGANIEEAIGGQSDKDFLSKISISYKEARETAYWIRLLEASGYLTTTDSQSLLQDLDEICRILGKIKITLQKRIKN